MTTARPNGYLDHHRSFQWANKNDTSPMLSVQADAASSYEISEVRRGRFIEKTTIHVNQKFNCEIEQFEGCCQERWGFSRIHAHRHIEAADVRNELLPIGNTLPANGLNQHSVKALRDHRVCSSSQKTIMPRRLSFSIAWAASSELFLSMASLNLANQKIGSRRSSRSVDVKRTVLRLMIDIEN